MDKNIPDNPSKNKLNLEALKSRRILESAGNQVDLLRTDLRRYSQDLATVSLALVKESEIRLETTSKMEDTLGEIKSMSLKDLQGLKEQHWRSLSEREDQFGKQIENVCKILLETREAQKSLEHTLNWLKEINPKLRQEAKDNHKLASQLKSTTWQILLVVSLLLSILGGVAGWFLHEQFMN